MTIKIIRLLTLTLVSAEQADFSDNVDQDQTAQNVQSDLRSTLSDKKDHSLNHFPNDKFKTLPN